MGEGEGRPLARVGPAHDIVGGDAALPLRIRLALFSNRLVGRGPKGRPLDPIELRGISHSFAIDGSRLAVLDSIDLRVPANEIVTIVGPNGCGKSTLLRVINGLLPVEVGEVMAFGSPVQGVDSRIGLVFQEPRLLPWRDVLSNIALPLELTGVGVTERERRAHAALELTGLHGFASAMPHQLSGGMAQRAALARALVPEPDVLLLDEPFSALDAMTRERLDTELLELWRRTGTTIVLVTHSISEAVFLADRVLVMSARPGHVMAEIQIDAQRPRNMTGSDSATFSSAADQVRAALASDRTAPSPGVIAA